MAVIDVGSGAIDRAWAATTNFTVIDLANPCNLDGTIESVEAWFAIAATGVKIGVFYGSGTSYTCRSFINIGNVIAGEKVTTPCSLACQAGDFIGIYVASGNLAAALSGGAGSMWKTADQMETGEQTYVDGGAAVLSLYATGTSSAVAAPTVTTQPPTTFYATSAVGHGTVVSNGGAAITERGVCWKTSSPPTTADSTSHDATDALGAFSFDITGLTAGLTYYVRAYAINSEGTSYGEEYSFVAPNLDIGNAVIARLAAWPSNYTIIDLANPCNGNGVINAVKLWFATAAAGVKVGVFYGSGTSYTCRSFATLGNVAAGALVEFTGLSLAVQAGDFIGIYANSGLIARTGTGGSGVYYKTGDQMEAGSQEYSNSYSDADIISLFATGIETIAGTMWVGTGIGDYIYGLAKDASYLYPAMYMERWSPMPRIYKGKIAQVDPTTMASTAVAPWSGAEGQILYGAPTDGTYLYANVQDNNLSSSTIVKITAADLTETGDSITFTGYWVSYSPIVSGGFIYCVLDPWTVGGYVHYIKQLQDSDLTVTATSPALDYYFPEGTVVDGAYLYVTAPKFNAEFTIGTMHLLKLNTSNLSLVWDITQSKPAPQTFIQNRCREILVLGDYVYCLMHTWPQSGVNAALFKYQKSDGAWVATLDFGQPSAERMITDGTYIYASVNRSIFKIEPTTMTILGVVQPNTGGGVFGGAITIIGTDIYIGAETTPGVIEKIALATFGTPPATILVDTVSPNPTSAVVTATVLADGGFTITERGVCYDTASAPTTSDSKVVDADTTLGQFTVTLTPLLANTTYYARAYIITSDATTYSSRELVFTTTSSGISTSHRLSSSLLAGRGGSRTTSPEIKVISVGNPER